MTCEILITIPDAVHYEVSDERVPVEFCAGPFDGLVLDLPPAHILTMDTSVSGKLTQHDYERTGFSRQGARRVLLYQHLCIRQGSPDT